MDLFDRNQDFTAKLTLSCLPRLTDGGKEYILTLTVDTIITIDEQHYSFVFRLKSNVKNKNKGILNLGEF